MNNETFVRDNKRKNTEKREIEIKINYLSTNPYSVLIKFGKTKVLCAATTGNWMPAHLRETGKGWIGAEYSMLPSSSPQRIKRERQNVKGRTREIERLIGRALRSVCELKVIPNESILVDCDVIEADGGTRTASITGGFVALYLLLKDLQNRNKISRLPITDFLAAISVGIVHGQPVLDLNSYEDKIAQVDMNLVITDSERFAEIQATGEEATFRQSQFEEMIELGKRGIKELIIEQKKALSII